MRFVIDGMFPSEVADRLNSGQHDAVTPVDLGAHSLPDDVLVQIAAAEGRVLVTENASDCAQVTTCTVLFVRKSWWKPEALTASLAKALDRWAAAHPEPGPWPHWMESGVR